MLPSDEKYGKNQFCSIACREADRHLKHTEERKCKKCQKPFSAHLSAIKNGGGLYCSLDCWKTSVEKIIRPCASCGKPMELTKAESSQVRQHCSKECMANRYASDPEYLKRLADLRARALAKAAPTRCEVVLYELMDLATGAGNWKRQHQVFHWVVDAAVPERKSVIQADGDYWHGLIAAKRGKPLEPRILKNVQNDRAQDAYLEKSGWRILRLWESELLRDRDSCLRRIKAFLNGEALR